VIAGVDWVTGDHQAGRPAVANMSLGGGQSAALDQAVRGSIADGITYAVAAGNDGTDACAGSPAGVPEAITVGATDAADARADFSDVGSCVDLFAPGVDIVSAWWLTDASSNTLSGTSMATPHVVGAAAKLLEASPASTPAQVAAGLAAAATKGVVSDAHSPHPDLLYSD
jgi:subtilisin family serine protease